MARTKPSLPKSIRTHTSVRAADLTDKESLRTSIECQQLVATGKRLRLLEGNPAYDGSISSGTIIQPRD